MAAAHFAHSFTTPLRCHKSITIRFGPPLPLPCGPLLLPKMALNPPTKGATPPEGRGLPVEDRAATAEPPTGAPAEDAPLAVGLRSSATSRHVPAREGAASRRQRPAMERADSPAG